jgi:hypothetical protein
LRLFDIFVKNALAIGMNRRNIDSKFNAHGVHKIGAITMREEIKDSVERMSSDDRADVAITCNLKDSKKSTILRAALNDECVAEYVLQY